MTYQYDLDPKLFTVEKENIKVLVCNNCSLEQQYYIYNKQKEVYCTCLNQVLRSRGSKVKLVNAKEKDSDQKSITEAPVMVEHNPVTSP